MDNIPSKRWFISWQDIKKTKHHSIFWTPTWCNCLGYGKVPGWENCFRAIGWWLHLA